MNPIGNQETGVGTESRSSGEHNEKAPLPLPGTDLGTPPVVYEKGLDKTADDESDAFVALVHAERGHDIKLRTMSWQKTACILFAEYVCLAILAQPWSYSVLGMAGGLMVTFGIGAITIYTSYVMWEYIMVHPEVRNICDIGYLLGGRTRLAYEATGFMLLANNILLIGFHVLTGSKILNTLSDHSQCTVVFSAIIAIIGIIFSIPRTLNHIVPMSIVSAIVMFIAVILGLAFAGAEVHPGSGYGPKGGLWPTLGDTVVVRAFSPPGTTFIDGLNAALNITFLWIGQIVYPSFVAEMTNPRDFPKALAALSVAELVLFSVPAVVGYRYLGQYAKAPLFASLLTPGYKKGGFGPVILPTVIIAVIYVNPTAKYIYQRLMGNSRHAHSHSLVGWGVWMAVIVAIWALAFVFGEVIPSFGDFLSVLSAAFDSFYGSLFWVACWFELNRGRYLAGPRQITMLIINLGIGAIGLFMLGPGMYAAVKQIVIDYEDTSPAFSCADNSL